MSSVELGETFFVGGRYRLLEQLGKGGMGRVYRALDRLSAIQVALKQVLSGEEFLSVSDPDDSSLDPRLSLAREFQVLASLRHPNIIGVRDYGFDRERQPYFTMELLENGQNIIEMGRRCDPSAQIHLLVQVFQALAYLHRRGLVHRDLKPGNVLVVPAKEGEGGPGEVKVLDFGLSVAIDRALGTVGTVLYMAPEVLRGDLAGPAADLYAVGVLAYELMAGRHPFRGDGTVNVIDRILNYSPDLGVLSGPPAARPIIKRLLAKNPTDRYEDAGQVIGDLYTLLKRPRPVETTATRESFLQAARFVGRKNEFKRLNDALDRALDGLGSAWLVGGESGVGKSRLVDELRTQALVDGAVVLRGQAIGEVSSPYSLWRGPVRRLILLHELDDIQAGVLKSLVPDVETLLERPVPDPLELEPQAAQSRLFSTITGLIQKLDYPLVIIVEDLQWAGPESLELLSSLNRIAPSQALLVLGNYRDDELPELPQRLPEMQLLTLQRLERPAVSELSVSMLGAAGRQPELLNLLNQETEGNPFFLVEVVRALAEEAGQLADVGTMDLPAHVVTGGLRQLVVRRLGRVPESDRPLLQLAAVAGRTLNRQLLAAAAPDVDLERWLTSGANAAVFAVQDERWQFAHDKLREGLLAEVSGERRRRLHQQVALAIEEAFPDAPDQAAQLTAHWTVAGNKTKEGHYAALAGKYALGSGAHHEAIEFLSRALICDQDRLETEGTHPGRTDRWRQARWLRQRGEAYLALAQFAESRASLEQGLALLGWPFPDGRFRLGWSLLVEVVKQLAHRFDPERFLSQAPAPEMSLMLEATRAYQQLAEIYYFANDKRRILACGLKALNLSERAGPSPELARAHANLCIITGLLRRDRWALNYSHLAQVAAEQADDAPARAWVLLLSGTYHIGLGHWETAQRLAERSMAICEQTGDKRVLGLVLALRSLVPYHKGQFAEAHDWCEAWSSTGGEIDNTQHQAAGLIGQAENLLRVGRPDDAVVLLDQVFALWAARSAHEELDLLGRFRGYAILANARLRLGELDLARDAVEQARALSSHVVSPNRVTMLDAVADQAEVYLALWDVSGPDKGLVNGSAHACRLLRRYSRVFPILEPRALLLRGKRRWLSGRRRDAVRNWQKGLARAAELEMPYELGLAHLELGCHGQGDARSHHLTLAEEQLRALDARYDLVQLRSA